MSEPDDKAEAGATSRTTTIRLTTDQFRRLAEMADWERRSQHNLLRKYVAEGLERDEARKEAGDRP